MLQWTDVEIHFSLIHIITEYWFKRVTMETTRNQLTHLRPSLRIHAQRGQVEEQIVECVSFHDVSLVLV